MQQDAATPTVTDIVAAEGRNGSLDGYECRCSCGLRMSNTSKLSLQLDAAKHLEWHGRRSA